MGEELNDYSSKSIVKPTDRFIVRTRINNFAGSKDIYGAFHIITEIVANSADEFKGGYGDSIDVIFNNEENEITIKDYGRGLPLEGVNEDGKESYKLLLYTLYAGAKYHNTEEGASYGSGALGSHGVGLVTCNLSSEYAEFTSVRDGKVLYNRSEKGEDITGIVVSRNEDNLPNGTTVTWKPDIEVFDDIEFTDEMILNYLDGQAVSNAGLTINYKSNKIEETLHYENGGKDFIEELSDGKGFSDIVDIEEEGVRGKDSGKGNKPEYSSDYEIHWQFNNTNRGMYCWHNSSNLTEDGAPQQGIKRAFTQALDDYLKDNNKYNKNESKVDFEDIEDSLLVVSITESDYSDYKHQTKKSIGNSFIRNHITKLLKESIKFYLIENHEVAEDIALQVLTNKRSREQAEKTRVDVRKKLRKVNSNISNKVEGYYPPKGTKDKSERILAICEGKSALSSMTEGRDAHTYGIFPIRGKILNTFKATDKQIADNDLIMDIYSILGCGMELNGKKGSKSNNFDIDKLNFGKIAIFADADEDGVGSILPLLLVMFQRLSPELLEQGKVYFGQTPKYEVKTVDEEFYAFNDQEFDDIKKKLGKTKYEVNYVKGLGELNRDGITRCMRPEGDNLLQIKVDDDRSIDILQMFMGKDVKERRKIILDSFEGDID